MAYSEGGWIGCDRLMEAISASSTRGALLPEGSHTPAVSVVIPVYNGERYLAEAIDSALKQTWADTEIIIVDDGSTDRTAGVAATYGAAVKYHSQSHAGSGAARNRGVEAARGSFFAFLDADDVWTPEKLTLQLAAFEARPDVDVVYGHVKQFHSPDLTETARRQIQCSEGAAPGYLPGTMMVKRDAFLRVGSFVENVEVGEHIDWHMRSTGIGLNVVMLPDILLWRRLHENNLGRRRRDARTDYVRVLRAAIERRRAEQETNLCLDASHSTGQD